MHCVITADGTFENRCDREAAEEEDTMRFLQLSDLHFRKEYIQAESGYLSVFKHMTSPLTQLERLLHEDTLRQIDFALVCGDLTERGTPEDYPRLKMRLDRVFEGIPYLAVPGNHDDSTLFRKVWYGNRADQYTFGTSSVFNDVQVVAMDNSSPDTPDGLISQQHVDWLREKFEDASGCRRRILMMHHPLVFDPRVPVPTVSRTETFDALLDRYHPDMILCGHTHNYRCSTYRRLLHVTCDGLSFRGSTHADGNVTFREHAGLNKVLMDDTSIRVERVTVPGEEKILARARMA